MHYGCQKQYDFFEHNLCDYLPECLKINEVDYSKRDYRKNAIHKS